MAQELINLGALADDGTGDTIRRAGIKINNNFTELYLKPFAQSSLGIIQNEISTTQSNADIVFKPSGTGNIVFPAITLNDNNIEGTRSNEDLFLRANGAGRLVIEGIGFGGTTISSSDSSIVNINENLVVDGNFSTSGGFTFSGAQTFVSPSVVADFTFANGSITNSSGAISFGNENLTTTGTLSAETGSSLGNITFADGSITDSSGAISFGNENLSTTGTISAESGSTLGNLTFADGSITDSSGAISFSNENLSTTGTSFAINSTLTVANGSITDSSGAISFGNENVTTTGTIARGTGSTIGNLTLGNGSITDSSGAISFGNENLTTTATSIAINSTLTVGNGSITDSTGAITFGDENVTTTGTISRATGSTIGNLTLANGSITDSSGAISFGNENLTTTATSSQIGTLTVANGSITDSSGAISFGNENVTTSGTIARATGSTIGNLTLANGSITDSSGAISFGNENLTTSSTSIAINSTLTVANGSITDSTGAITFGNENVTTTGTIARGSGSTIGNLTLANGSITDSSGAISFGNENLTTSASSMAIGSTMTAGSGAITDTTGAISFGNDNLTTTGTLDVSGLSTLGSLTTVSGATSFAGSTTIDNLTFNDNIISTSSNADLNLSPGGTGVVNVSNLTIDSSINLTDNVIKVTKSNDDFVLSGNGTGSVQISKIDMNQGTVDNTVIGGTTPAAGDFTTVSFTVPNINAGNVNITDNKIKSTDTGGNLLFLPSGSGNVLINGFTFPNSMVAGRQIKTDANKVLSTVAPPSFVVTDTDVQDGRTTISFANRTDIDHVTAAGGHDRIESSVAVQDNFLTSQYDSAFYLAVNRDDASDEFEVTKHSVVHNNSNVFITSTINARTGTNNHVTTTVDINAGLVRLLGTGSSPENSVSYYRIGLGDDDSTGYSGEDEAAVVINTDVDSASEVIDSWAHASFRGAKYYISVNNASKTELMNCEATLVHNGTDAFVSTYNIVNTGNNDLITLTAAINGSNVELKAAGLETNLRVHAYRIRLADNEADRSSTNINVIGNVTVSSSTTTLDTFSTGTYQAAHYVIVSHNAAEGHSAICEAAVVSDGTNAFVTQYGLTSTKGTDQIILSVGHAGSTTTLSATSTSGGSTKVNAYRVNLARGAGTSTAVATLDSISATAYRAVYYLVQVTDSVGNNFESFQVQSVHDGTNVFTSVYGNVGNQVNLISVSGDLDSGNLRLRGTISNLNDHEIVVLRRIIKV